MGSDLPKASCGGVCSYSSAPVYDDIAMPEYYTANDRAASVLRYSAQGQMEV